MKKDKCHMISFIRESKEQHKTNKLIDTENEFMVAIWERGGPDCRHNAYEEVQAFVRPSLRIQTESR